MLQKNDVVRLNIWFQMNIGFKLEHKGQLFALDEHCHFYTIMPEKEKHLWLRFAKNCYSINLQEQFIEMQGANICSLFYSSSS